MVFDESKVRRGMPDNAGQFAPKTGTVSQEQLDRLAAQSAPSEPAACPLCGEEDCDGACATASPLIIGPHGTPSDDEDAYMNLLEAESMGDPPSTIRPDDVLSDVEQSLELLDDDGDFDALRDVGLIDSHTHARAVFALRDLRDSLRDGEAEPLPEGWAPPEFDTDLPRFTPEAEAELQRLEAVFEAAGGRGVDEAEQIDALRALRDGHLHGLSPSDMVSAAEEALALLDDNGDIDALRDQGDIHEAKYAAAVHAVRALRDHLGGSRDSESHAEERACATCGGQGCEEGCGRCEMAYAGPNSHKVCRACNGQGTMTDARPVARTCVDCGEPIEDDPDGSPGVVVHARGLGDRAHDLDEEHAAIPDDSADSFASLSPAARESWLAGMAGDEEAGPWSADMADHRMMFVVAEGPLARGVVDKAKRAETEAWGWWARERFKDTGDPLYEAFRGGLAAAPVILMGHNLDPDNPQDPYGAITSWREGRGIHPHLADTALQMMGQRRSTAHSRGTFRVLVRRAPTEAAYRGAMTAAAVMSGVEDSWGLNEDRDRTVIGGL